MPMLLELRNIGKAYDETAVLEAVDLSLDRGSSMAITAPSGAGKSTLLSIAGLLLAPTSGEVLIDGVDAGGLTDDERSHLRADKIGFLFQHTQMIGSLRAVENVTVPARFASEPRPEVAKRAIEMLGSLGMGDRVDYYPHQLSIGQRRRVATARALINDPALIIADEPTNDLDAENAEIVMRALFDRVAAGESALLYATHDPDLASRADTVLKLV